MVGVAVRQFAPLGGHRLRQRQAVEDLEVLLRARHIGGEALAADPRLAGHDHRDAHGRHLHARLGVEDDHAVGVFAQSVGGGLVLGLQHEDVLRQAAREGLVQLRRRELARGDPAPDLGGVHPDDELQLVGALAPVLDGLDQPVQHVGEGVGLVVELRVPDDAGEQGDIGLGRIASGLDQHRGDVLLGRVVEPDPVVGPRAAAPQVGADVAGQLRRHVQGVPVLHRLVQHGEVVALVVREDEGMLAVGGVVGDHPHAHRPGHLGDHPLGDVDAVVDHQDVVLALLQQAADAADGPEPRLEIDAQHLLAERLVLQVAPGEVTQGAGPGVVAHRQAVPVEAADILVGDGFGGAPGELGVHRGDVVAEALHRIAEVAEGLLAAVDAEVAVGHRLLGGQVLGQGAGRPDLDHLAGRHALVAEQHLDVRAPDVEGAGQHAVQGGGVIVASHGGGEADAGAA